MRCLLVDDVNIALDWEEDLIKDCLHCDVVCVGKFEDAVHELNNRDYELLVADYSLDGGGDGVTLCRLAKQKQAGLATVLLTGKTEDKKWDGVDLFLRKDWSTDKLREKLLCL